MCFTGNSLCKQRFACAGRAHQQGPLGHRCADGLILFRVVQKIHDLLERFLRLILTGYVGKCFAGLCSNIDFGVALAKRHGIRSAHFFCILRISR